VQVAKKCGLGVGRGLGKKKKAVISTATSARKTQTAEDGIESGRYGRDPEQECEQRSASGQEECRWGGRKEGRTARESTERLEREARRCGIYGDEMIDHPRGIAVRGGA